MSAGPSPVVVRDLADFFAAELWPAWRRVTRGAPVALAVRLVWWRDGAVGLADGYFRGVSP